MERSIIFTMQVCIYKNPDVKFAQKIHEWIAKSISWCSKLFPRTLLASPEALCLLPFDEWNARIEVYPFL